MGIVEVWRFDWRRLWGRGRERRHQRAEGGPGAAPRSTLPYSPQYETIVRQGHEQPTPVFAAPALVWHVGVWPRETADPQRDRARSADLRLAWVREIDAQLAQIQTIGRWRRASGSPLKRFLEPDALKAPDSGAVVMTLWWKADDTAAGEAAALRVKLHCNLTPDFFTYSFYMDVGTLWDQGAAPPAEPEPNPFRARVLAAVTAIREICTRAAADAQARPGQVTRDPLEAADDARLVEARNVLYVQTWERFAAAFGCAPAALAGTRGEIFANFRGVVLPAGETGIAGSAAERFPRFSADPRFAADGIEANAVVDTYWPFVRRIVPAADFREFVVCGLMHWRALYITALGAPSQYDPGEERAPSLADKSEADILVDRQLLETGAPGLPEHDTCVAPRTSARSGFNHPVRYLMLTKAEPNPRQLGRIVERINALGTLRLYALKDWHVIEAADGTLRSLGQELDDITSAWSEKRSLVDTLDSFKKIKHARTDRRFETIWPYLRDVDSPNWWSRLLSRARVFAAGVASLDFKNLWQLWQREEANKLMDFRYALLAVISATFEKDLIRIGAALDALGKDAAGGLHFRVGRSGIHVAEFKELLEMLQVGNVQTWTSYEQFVTRGLAPAFAYIASVGTRVHALRERLIAVLETIETSALVGQSSATRHNTGELRRLLNIGLVVLIGFGAKIFGAWGALLTFVPWVLRRLGLGF